MTKYSELYAGLKPYIVELIRSTSLVAGAGTGTSGTGMQVHALDSSWHTGELDPSQATWALSSYRTVAAGAGLTGGGNLTADISLDVAAGDGIEVTGDAVQVKLKTTSGLELDATGLSVVTPATLTVASTNSLANHTHAITSSSNPGAAASLLATDSNGLLTLVQFKVGAAATYNSNNDITVAPDVQFATSGMFSAETSLFWNIDSNNDSTNAYFRWGINAATSASAELMRLTEAGNLGIGDNSPDDALDVVGTGHFTTSVKTPVLTGVGAVTLSPVTDVILTPGSNLVKLSADVALQSANFVSQTTGMRVTYDGQADFRYLFVDEMHAKSFIADLEQALAGGQIICKSVAVLYEDFFAPAAADTAQLTVRDLPSATGMAVFVDNDFVRLRTFSRAAGALTIADCWGRVVLNTAYGTGGFDSATKTQRYTFTRSSSPNQGAMSVGTAVRADAIVLDYGTSGNGYYEVNAVDGAYGVNSPYAQIVTWATHPRTQTVRGRLGNLVGIFSEGAEYGLFAGSGVTNADQYLRISDAGVQLNNIPLKLYASGTQRVNIDSTGTDVWFKNATGDVKLAWNGSTLTVNGDGTFSGTVTASAGAIAGWTIQTSQIENLSNRIRLVSGGGGTARLEVGDGTTSTITAGISSRTGATGIAFWAGETHANAATAPFRVRMDGVLTATSATLTGSFTAGNVTIDPTNAMKIEVGAALSSGSAVNLTASGTIFASIGGLTVGASGLFYITCSTGIYLNGPVYLYSGGSPGGSLETTGNITAAKFVASGATGYLRASTTDILSWTSSGVTTTASLTAPSVRAASGTWYAGVGATNYLGVSSTKITTTATQFGNDWVNASVYDAPSTGGWVTGWQGRSKIFGDVVWTQGRFDPENTVSPNQTKKICTLDSSHAPAREITKMIVAHKYVGGYEYTTAVIDTGGGITIALINAWNTYDWVDLDMQWSVA